MLQAFGSWKYCGFSLGQPGFWDWAAHNVEMQE